jgi:hypothetical protein
MSIVSSSPQQVRPQAKDHLRLPAPPPLYNLDVNSEFNGENESITVENIRAITRKMHNVLTVVAGEEHFEPLWGSRLPFRLFENMGAGDAGTDSTAFMIEFDTIQAITSFVSLDVQVLHGDAKVTPLTNGQDGYEVYMPFVHKKSRQLDAFRYRLVRPTS